MSVFAFVAGTQAQTEWDAEKYLVYSFGKVSLRPQLELGTTYDSNIFYAETDEVDDFFLTVRPGLSFVYGEKTDNFISVRYTLDASIYADRDDLNNVGHLVNHETRLRLTRWTVQANDAYSFTKTLLGGAFSYIQKRIGLVSLAPNWRADYEISPKALVGVKTGLEYVNYDGADLAPNHLYDYLGYFLGTRFGYLPSEKIVVFPEFTYGQSFLSRNDDRYPEAPDVTLYGFSLGAEGDFTPVLTGIVTGGYEIRDYSDGTDIPDGWVADVRMRWQARPKTALSVGYRHFIQVSREVRAVAYTSHRPNLSVTQDLGTQGKWNVTLDASYQFDDYQDGFLIGNQVVPRSNEYLMAALRANWRWQPWLTISGGYEFRNYTDDIQSIPDYDIHRVSLRAVAGF